MYLGFESLTLRQNEKQVARPAFCFGKTKRGIRTRREQTKSAEENSPVDCFCRRGQGAKRREGAQECTEKIPNSPPKWRAGRKACFLLWQNKKRVRTRREQNCLRKKTVRWTVFADGVKKRSDAKVHKSAPKKSLTLRHEVR